MKESIHLCNGLALNYMEHGHQGPVILLLHGATNRWQTYMPIISDLADHAHLYALDLRGHGQSAHAKSYTLQDYLDDTVAFISECIKKPVIIVGHSLGGMIGVLLAVYHPELVQKLVMIDTPLTLDSLKRLSTGPVAHANWLIDGLRFSQFMPGFPLPEGLKQCDPEMLAATVNEFDQTFHLYKNQDLFTKIKCPALLIRGSVELGSLITDADLNTTMSLMPHLIHIQIAHTGHTPVRQDTQAVLDALYLFLEL
jgi:pimeloyl-ACP methyl ester carboxylesterase